MAGPALPAGFALDPAETPTPQASGGPVYDAAHDVGRNPDGSIAYVPNPNRAGASISSDAQGILVDPTGASDAESYSSFPDHVRAWVAANPDAAAPHKPGAPSDGPSAAGPTATPKLPAGYAIDGADGQPAPKAPVSTAEDVGRGALGGMERGVVGSLTQTLDQLEAVNPVTKLAHMAGNWAVEHGFTALAPAVGIDPNVAKAAATVATAKPNAANIIGGDYHAESVPGQYAETAGEFLPAAAMGEGGVIPRLAQSVIPAVASETAGQFTKGTSMEAPARLIAALVSGAATGPKLAMAPNRAALDATADETLAGLNTPRAAMEPDVRARIEAAIAAGKSPEQAATRAATESLPVKVPLTKGQETGEPGQQLFENLTLRGAHGPDAQRMMAGHMQEQQGALRANVSGISERLAGGAAPGRGEGGAAVSDALNKRFDAAKRGVDSAYDDARAAGADQAHLPAGEAPNIAAAVRESVRDFDPETVPAVTREIAKLDTKGTLTARDLFEARSRLTQLRAADAVTAKAAGNAVRALDHQIDDAVSRDLLTGDPAVVAKWREAISQRKAMGKLFEGNDLVAKLTARTRHGEGRSLVVDPGDAANYIFGRSDMGFVGRQNLYRDLTRLRTVLGPDSQAWNSLRAEAFQRIAGTGEGPTENGQRLFSGAKFNRAWTDFIAKDPRLASRLFSEDERSLISRFAKVAAKATTPVRGGDNPSNTSVALVRLVNELAITPFIRAVPFIGEHILEGIEHGISVRGASKAINPKLDKAVKGAPWVARSAPAAMVAAAQAQQNRQ